MIGVLALFLLRLVGVCVWLKINYDETEHGAAMQAYQMARLLEAQMLATDREVDLLLDDLANVSRRLPTEAPYDWNSEAGQQANATVAEQIARMPDVAAVSILDADAKVAYSTKAPRGKSLIDLPYIQQAMAQPNQGMSISAPYRLHTTGRPGVAFGKAVLDAQGKLHALIAVGVHVEAWSHHLPELDLGRHGTAMLVDSDGRLIARFPSPDQSMFGKRVEIRDVVSTGRYPETYFATSGFDGQRRLMSMRQVGVYPFKVMVCLSPADYLAPWRLYLYMAVAALLAVAMLCAFLIVLLWRGGVQSRALAESEVKLRHREAHLRSLLAFAPSALCLVDFRADAVRFVNGEMAALLGVTTAALDGTAPGALFVQPEAWAGLREALGEKGTVRDQEHLVHTAHGGQRWVTLSATVLADGDDGDEVVLSLLDVTERHDRERRLSEQAATDPLTGLANRRSFFERGHEVLELAKRHQRPLSVLMLDLDHFKLVNDQFGHAVGDDVLVRVARLLETSRRQGDLPARLGGEEFVILLPETPLDKAIEAGERIREAVENAPLTLDDGTLVAFTISIGVAQSQAEPEADLESLLEIADVALYRAKQRGRNRVESAPANPNS